MLDKDCYITLAFTSIDTLNKQELSQCYLPNLDSIDVIKASLVIRIKILLLDSYLPVVVELESEEEMVCALDLEVVARSKRVDHALLSFLVLDYARFILPKGQKFHAIF